MQLEEFEITGAVDEYIKRCLSHGTTLMKKILLQADISHAKKYTYWTKDFPLHTINDFDNYLNVRGITDATTKWVVDKIRKFIASTKNAIAVSEESVIDSSDPHLNSPDDPPCFTSEIKYQDGKEVYYFVDRRYCTQVHIEDSLSLSGRAGPFSSTALIELPENIKIEKNMEVSERILDILSSNVEHLIFGTFDLEGYIICSFDNKL